MAILFLQDWKMYPDAVIHYETRNKSALDLAAKYRMMGVKNSAFILALHNPHLRDVDPYDPNLDLATKQLILLEIKNNPWYYLREIARAPGSAGGNGRLIDLNRANVALWWCFFNHITVILTQPRQTGKSFSADLLATYLVNFKCSGTTIHLLTKDDKLRGENMERLKKIYDELPDYLNFKSRDDVNNTEHFSINRLGNAYKAHVPRADEKGANNLGRGMSTPILFIDEPPFQKNLGISLPAAVGAMGARIKEAQANNAPYGLVMTTTAGKKDDPDGAYAYQMVEASAPFSELFYDCEDQIQLEKMVTRAGRGNYRTYICFSHIQLGYSDEWLFKQINLVPTTPEQVNRDYFNVWTAGTGSSPFDVALLEKVAASERDPDHRSFEHNNYLIRWYISPSEVDAYMSTRDCVAGLDTSDAVGKDEISMVFVDAQTGATVAAANINETNLIDVAMFLLEMIVKYPKFVLVPERKGSAITIIDYLLMFLPQRGIDPFKRIFNLIVDDSDSYPEQYAQLRSPAQTRGDIFYTRCKSSFGFTTAGSGRMARDKLYRDTILAAIKRNANTVYDRTLGSQIRSLQVKNGRIDHPNGEHDDHVVAWLLCHWFLMYGKNLSFYGINPIGVLSSSAYSSNKVNPAQLMQDQIQMGVRRQINELMQEIASESNEVIAQRLESQLRQLDARLVLKDGEVFSVDKFLTEMKDRKKHMRVMNRQVDQTSIGEQLGYRQIKQRDIQRLPGNTYVM